MVSRLKLAALLVILLAVFLISNFAVKPSGNIAINEHESPMENASINAYGPNENSESKDSEFEQIKIDSKQKKGISSLSEITSMLDAQEMISTNVKVEIIPGIIEKNEIK